MIPVCDHNSYYDGKCFTSGINLHFSHPHHDPRLGVAVSKMRDVFFYTGRHVMLRPAGRICSVLGEHACDEGLAWQCVTGWCCMVW